MAVETVVTECLHHFVSQFIRPSRKIELPEDLRPKGVGNCYECTIDPLNNGHCLGCKPVAVHYFMVEENSTEPTEETYSGNTSNGDSA